MRKNQVNKEQGSSIVMATVDGYLLSSSERQFIRDGIYSDLRADGRSRLEYRRLNVEFDPIPQAAGSSRVSLGETEVLVSVKGDISEANTGQIMFSVDTSSSSLSILRESDDRVVRQEECEIKATILSRIFANSLDLEQLIIARNRFSWTLFIDVLIMQDSGNLLDTMVAAVRAALIRTRLPKVMVEEGEAVGLSVSDDPNDLKSLSCIQLPILTTFAIYGNESVIAADPSASEESSSDYLVSVGMNHSGHVTYSRKHHCQNSTGAITSCNPDVLERIIFNAKSLSPSIIAETKTIDSC